MMRLTRTGIGLLTAQYRSVLKKCFLINAGLFLALAPNVAEAVDIGSYAYSDAQTAKPGWDANTYITPSRNTVPYEVNNHNYQTITQGATIVQNLEKIDYLIGSFPVLSAGRMPGQGNGNWNYTVDVGMRNNLPMYTVDSSDTILANITQIDYVLGLLQSGNYISNMKSLGDNLKLLDTAIGAKKTGTYITGSDVYSNLKALDTQVAANTSTIAAHTAVINALDNNYYRNIEVSRAEKLQKTSAVIVRSAKHDVTIFGRKSDKTVLCAEILQSLRSFRMTEAVANDNHATTTGNTTMYKKEA